jgi:phage/plasmid-like protein (TIGR03299 family)
MAHQIERMAYVGDTPWHQLGHQLPPHQPIEVWAQQAGMAWSICESPMHYAIEAGNVDDTGTRTGTVLPFAEHKVLYRSDTRAPLSVVGHRYQVVQPQTVLEFYRDLTELSGFELETAGVLKAGKKFWALARTGAQATLQGRDVVTGYVLLATSCDGSLATTVTPTTVRVVCANTLTIAVNEATGAVRVPHSTVFDPQVVKKQLGIAVAGWDAFMYRMKGLAERKVKHAEVERFLCQVLVPSTPANLKPAQAAAASTAVPAQSLKKIQSLYEGHGRGAELGAAKGTAWGLLCAVTEYVDHERRARSADYRLDSAWFGAGAGLKQRALEAAIALAD